MNANDPDYERLKDDDFADAKPVSTFPHLIKHQLTRFHRLNVEIDDDLARWLADTVPADQYSRILNSALRAFRQQQAA